MLLSLFYSLLTYYSVDDEWEVDARFWWHICEGAGHREEFLRKIADLAYDRCRNSANYQGW